MDLKGYITEYITEVWNAPVSSRMDWNEMYLWYIASGTNSAYKIYAEENSPDEPTESKTKDIQAYSIAYKNVHKRVQKLLKYGLIEEIIIPGGFKHGARNYRLKTRGLVYIFSKLLAPGNFIDFISSHHEDLLFKTFLYPFLERRTIKNATYTLTKMISNYITECCETTRYCLNLTADFVKEDEVLAESDLFHIEPINYMYYRLNSSMRSFIVRCAILNEEFEDWDSYVMNKGWRGDPLPTEGKIFCLANDKKETQLLLARDKLFMTFLRKVEEEFRHGFNTLKIGYR
jgi:hypothetical protein